MEIMEKRIATIYSISPDGFERYDIVRPETVGKRITLLKRQGYHEVRVVS
jgi:hypothetical protein